MKIKAISGILAIFMLITVFNGCTPSPAKVSSPASNAVSGPYAKFPQTIQMTIGRPDVAQTDLPTGDTMTHNLFLDDIKSDLNINVSYAWLGSGTDSQQYNEKVNLVIASGNLPDVMYVENQNQVMQMAQAGMLENLGPTFESNLCPDLKTFFDSFPSDIKYSTAMYNGQQIAVPEENPAYQYAEMWIRKDWMTKVGAKTPKTLDDVINLAKTFMAKDPGGNGAGKTIGIAVALSSGAVAGNYNAQNDLDSIFNSFQSYPQSWIKGTSGQYTYGSVAPETKTALTAIAAMYKEGVIDPEFAVHTQTDEDAILTAGKCGIMFGPWWMPYYPLNTAQQNNPKSDWVAVMAPISSDGNYYATLPNPHTAWIVVKKGYKYPQAIPEVLNLSYMGNYRIDPKVANVNPDLITHYQGLSVMWTVYPLPLMIESYDFILQKYYTLDKAWLAKSPAGLNNENTTLYNSFLKNEANPGADPVPWQDWTARMVGSALMANNINIVKYPTIGFPAETATQTIKWTELQTLEDQTFLQIIMGQKPISYFDTFVTQWNQEGGTQITKEVNSQLNQ